MACSGCPPCPAHGQECVSVKAHGDRPPICLHPLRGKAWCRWTTPTKEDRCPKHGLRFTRKGLDGFMCLYDCPHWRRP